MKNSLLRIVKWFCRRLTFNELSSAVVIFHEVLSGSRQDIKFKPEEPPPNYRQFRVDDVPPLTAPPELFAKPPTKDWLELKADYKQRTGKELHPVVRHDKSKAPLVGCTCEHCNAPSRYLYLNDGKKGSQVLCKICGGLSVTHRTRRESLAKYYCPHCGYALSKWKERPTETIFKCPNVKCPHYKKALSALTPKEKAMRTNIYNPNFKLRYQFREYHLSPADIAPARPETQTKVALSRIHNNYHVVGLVLSLFINIGLSSRQTRDALKGLFGIELSHQTVINYVNAAAAAISPWLDKNLPVPRGIAAADETYVIVDNEWHYTWFIIDKFNRAVCGYNLSTHRDTVPALATLHNAYGPPSEKQRSSTLVADGLSSYDAAVMAYNQGLEKPVLKRKTVIGLENCDDESREFRPFKQIVERLNRTYKFHTRPRAGFKSFDGAVSLTTLFVAFYNFMRPHSFWKKPHPPVFLEFLKDAQFFPKQWELLLKEAFS